jgi:hypothetical protein
MKVNLAHHQANCIGRNHFVKRLQTNDAQAGKLILITRHSSANEKLREGQQTEQKSGCNQKLQNKNIQNLPIDAVR